MFMNEFMLNKFFILQNFNLFLDFPQKLLLYKY